MMAAAPWPEVLHLMRNVACLPHGLALVEFGARDTVATMLAVAPGVVDEARGALADPGRRQALLDAYESAAALRTRDFEGFCEHCPARAGDPAPWCPLALLREAEQRPAGLELLTSAALETAATLFAVHPFVVLGAREILDRRNRGLVPPASAGAVPQS
jgi:hypothetical protein